MDRHRVAGRDWRGTIALRDARVVYKANIATMLRSTVRRGSNKTIGIRKYL